MFAYYFLFGVFAIIAISAGSHPHGQHRTSFALSGVFLIVFIGLRYEVGGDWVPYLWMLSDFSLMDLPTALASADPAYAVLNWLVAQTGAGIWLVNLVCSVIFTFGLASLCRWQPNPALAVLVAIPYLVIVVAMGYTRQSVALGLIMLAMTQLHRGTYIKMGVYLVAAVMFHRSAVVVFPVFGLAASRNRFLSIFMVGALTVLVFFLFVSSGFNRFLEVYVGRSESSSGALVRVLMNVAPATFFFVLRDRLHFETAEKSLWKLFSLASLIAVVALALSPSSTAVDRTALYLIPLQVVVLARVPSALGNSNRQAMDLIVAVVLYSLAVQSVWLNFGQFSHKWVPYRNYLFVGVTR